MDSGIVLKSLINVISLSRRHNSSYVINPTFILNLLTYLQVCTLKLYSSKSPPIESYIHIYMNLSHDCIKTLIGCFLIWILSGTSIIYASSMHMHILLYITMTQLQSIMTAVHEYGIYETGLNAISTTDLFDTFTKTLWVGYDNVALGLTPLVAAWALVVPWLLTPSMTSLVYLLSLLSTLSKAHLGYLHWVRAFLRWSLSCWSNSGLLHTVLSLWERVLITLNLAERWWWLSHCKDWSVCMGFLYTVMDSVPSTTGLTMVSKKGMDPSYLLSSTVNFMASMCWRKPCLLTSLWMTKVSSTNLC